MSITLGVGFIPQKFPGNVLRNMYEVRKTEKWFHARRSFKTGQLEKEKAFVFLGRLGVKELAAKFKRKLEQPPSQQPLFLDTTLL